MENRRFDALTRSLAGGISRRGFLAALGATIVGARAVSAQNGCPPGQTANKKGQCGCPSGTDACPGGCFDLRSDAANCGACGQTCIGGECRKTACRCPAGTRLCGGACLPTDADLANCGGCGVVCPAAPSPCLAAVCQAGACGFVPANEGLACSDGDACTAADVCLGGVCTGGEAVACTTDNPCLTASCDPATGCVTAPKPRGTPCDDATLCNGTEACDGAGTCAAGIAVVCAPPGPCQEAGVCDPTTGACAYANKADDTACDTGNRCTQDSCLAGACVEGADIVTPTCTASGQCRDAGTCVPATGLCSDPATADGTPCDDGDACTVDDTCQAGSCVPGPATGACGAANGVACTLDTQCASGFCTNGVCCNVATCGSNCQRCDVAESAGTCRNSCPGESACMNRGFCSGRDGGICGNPIPQADGTACGSFGPSLCVADAGACQAGACQPVPLVTCVSNDPCRDSVCDEGSGACVFVNNGNGTACDTGNPCTDDVCAAGVCTLGPARACVPIDDCHEAGVCNPATGICSTPNKPNGTECGGGTGDQDVLDCNWCQAGVCTPKSNGVSCGGGSRCESCRDGRCGDNFPVVGTTCPSLNDADCCLAGYCAANGFCESCQGPGAPCIRNRQCCSDSCSITFQCIG